jgi:predicted O-methyltransferase YrrM
MAMTPTQESLQLLRDISARMEGTTFHHHSHLLYDLPMRENGYYVEIGCFAGATACLMLQRQKTNVISIDLGHPIPQSMVQENIKRFNVHNNSYIYLEGNSQSQDTVNQLKKITQEIDILFIDGDHTKEGVMNDFLLYHEMVVPGGYVVFDDYNDHEYSPEVKPTVNAIVKNTNEYEIIGAIENIHGARPRTLLEGNCFVMRKL